MVRGLYTSALGMITQMKRMDVVSNNIANVDTTKKKKDQVASKSFTEELMKRIHDPGLRLFKDYRVGMVSQGVYVDDIYTDFSPGSFRNTGGALDLALDGQGFFCVTVNGEDLYTRDGTFVLYPDGTLATKDGGHVQGSSGDIRLPNGNINIDEMGRIFVNAEYIDTISTIDITDKHTLRAFKDNYWRTTDESETTAYTGSVIQGFLENSNVSTVREMVEMITLNRVYEANSRMISIHDQTLGRAVSDIGRK
jgi:flagellar basal-body rod protein FlgG